MFLKAALRVACRVSVIALASASFTHAAAAQSRADAHDFDLPAQPLAKALRSYERLTRQRVTFDSSSIGKRRSAAVRGRLSAADALDRILAGSGLSARRGADGAIAIVGEPGTATAQAGFRAETGADSDIVVVGSFIPSRETALPLPVTRLSLEELTERGFTSVADAIQRSPFSTGAIVGADAGYTQGARTSSLFSLGPGYTKYLIDGRPMGMYPALYNNQTNIVDLSSLPTALTESVEILPGGQSSLYGADAVAAVVNVKLRKALKAPVLTVRRGLTEQGGGQSWRVSGAGSVTLDRLNVLIGAQYDAIKPIWGYQRKPTAHPFAGNPDSPPVPDQAAGLYSARTFALVDFPRAYCDRLSSFFGNGVAYYNDGKESAYCGNSNVGFNTIANDERRLNLFTHATFDINEHVNLYADVLVGHAVTKFGYAQAYSFYYSGYDGVPYTVAGSTVPVYPIRYIAPEERGGLDSLLSPQTTNTLHLSTGVKGAIGRNWLYDATYVHNRQSLEDVRKVTLTAPLQAYFGSILRSGGLDAFFSPIPAATVQGFYTNAIARASASSNWARALLTNGHLYRLPGGDAGIALGVEGGNERWRYTPDPGYAAKSFYYNLTDVSGDGNRNNVAVMAETRLPVLSFLTLSGSARYDRFFVSSVKTGKVSYNVAAELTPTSFLTLRGRYGTAFKAPTLADLFQGESSVLAAGYDYLTCARAGVSITNCRVYRLYSQRMSGNVALRPMTARVFDIGAVLRLDHNVQFSADVLHWDIRNGVSQEDSARILRDEARCATGSPEVDSARCALVAGYVSRTPAGALVSVYSQKVNITQQKQTSLVASASANLPIGDLGTINLSASYNLAVSRSFRASPTSNVSNAFVEPLSQGDFRSRTNAAITWSREKV